MTQQPPPPERSWADQNAPDPALGAAPAYPATGASSTAVAPASRPGIVTAASITLIVLGALTLLIGLFVGVGASMFAGAAGGLGQAADVPAGYESVMGAFAGVIILIVILVLGWGILEILVGIKAMAGRGWARITGIVLGVIGALLSLGGLTNPDAGGGVVINLAIAAAYIFVVFAFATAGAWFSSRSA